MTGTCTTYTLGGYIDQLKANALRRTAPAVPMDSFALDFAPNDVPIGGTAVATGSTAAGDSLVAVFIRHADAGPAARALLTAEQAEALADELRACAEVIREDV